MFKNFFQNTCKPQGLGGKFMVNMMNKGHAKMAAWGFSHLPKILTIDDALDIGCGGGANVATLLKKFPDAKITGMDYSDVSVTIASEVNHKAIRSGRCNILQGDASVLPFPPNSFDLVTAFETVYFWPNIENCFKQIYSSLRSNGLFLICNEESDPDNDPWIKIVNGMTVYSTGQLQKLMENAGFTSISCTADAHSKCICVIGKKCKDEPGTY